MSLKSCSSRPAHRNVQVTWCTEDTVSCPLCMLINIPSAEVTRLKGVIRQVTEANERKIQQIKAAIEFLKSNGESKPEAEMMISSGSNPLIHTKCPDCGDSGCIPYVPALLQKPEMMIYSGEYNCQLNQSHKVAHEKNDACNFVGCVPYVPVSHFMKQKLVKELEEEGKCPRCDNGQISQALHDDDGNYAGTVSGKCDCKKGEK